MWSVLVTLGLERSWSHIGAPENMAALTFFTFDTSHLDTSLLNPVAPENNSCMSTTRDTSHPEMSLLLHTQCGNNT